MVAFISLTPEFPAGVGNGPLYRDTKHWQNIGVKPTLWAKHWGQTYTLHFLSSEFVSHCSLPADDPR